MPVHDWTVVDAGIFHHFHFEWISALNGALNEGVLPDGYYALVEQHANRSIPDILTLHTTPAHLPPPDSQGGTAVLEAPPRVRRRQTLEIAADQRRRTLAIRHVSGHRLIALVEIVSPASKDRAASVSKFVAKIAEALEADVHVLLIDLFPPGRWDPGGFHATIARRVEGTTEEYQVPPDEPLTLAAYAAGSPVDAYIEHFAPGGTLPHMPLFLSADRYVNVPLEGTYVTAYRKVPAFWRDVVEGKRSVEE